MRANRYIQVTVVIIPGEEHNTSILRSGLKRNAHGVVDDAMDRIEEVYPGCAIAVMSEIKES